MGARVAFALYLSGTVVLTTGLQMGSPPGDKPVGALQRGLARGEIEPGVPRLDPRDPMSNAALLDLALAGVEHPGLGNGLTPCEAAPRTIAVQLGGRLSRVHFNGRAVCQLQRLKQISVAQPGFGQRGLAEVAAFVLGRRSGQTDVDVGRVVVPPFRSSSDTLTFISADLGPLEAGEELIGTYHTHPQGDLEQGVLSDVDLHFMRDGTVDFHGAVGRLRAPRGGLDWLIDIVEPRDGDWNVYAHDGPKLEELLRTCERETVCPLNELRLAGSKYFLLTRYYEERAGERFE